MQQFTRRSRGVTAQDQQHHVRRSGSQASSRTSSRSALAALIAVVALGPATPVFAQGGPPPAPVRVDAVRQETVQQQRRITGELRARQHSLVATHEQGLVLEVPVREGALVAQGDVLCRIDDERMRLLLQEAAASVQLAEAQIEERVSLLEQAQRDHEALLEVSQLSAANPKELKDAAAAVAAAKARLSQAEVSREVAAARARLLERRMKDTVITAPFDGIVVARQVEVGQWVSEGETIAEVVSTGVLEAWLDVPQENVAVMTRPGSDGPTTDLVVRVRVDAIGEVLPLEEVRIVPMIDRSARAFPLVGLLDDRGVLTPGMSITAWVPGGKMEEHLTVHRDAILRGPTGTYVYAVRGGGEGPASAVPANVDVLFEFADRAAVASRQLRAGDQVVIEGNERLFPGAPVLPTNSPAAAGPAPRSEASAGEPSAGAGG